MNNPMALAGEKQIVSPKQNNGIFGRFPVNEPPPVETPATMIEVHHAFFSAGVHFEELYTPPKN